MDSRTPRRYDGSNAQWLLKQNVYSILCDAQERMDEDIGGCILDIIFETSTYSPDHECRHYEVNGCKKCIEEFLYREHRRKEDEWSNTMRKIAFEDNLLD